MLPSLHAGHGLLKNDAYFYHQSAIALADNIRLHGWSAWSLWSSQTNTTGNVGILSAIYALFSPNPALIIPINAILHATSAAMLFLIGRELWSGRTGKIAGLLVAALFIFFPSALSWYSQPLKDTYVIAGVLMIAYSWLIAFRTTPGWKGWLFPLAWMATGTLLVTFVKPYYLKLLLVSILLAAVVLAVQLFRMKHPQRIRILSFYVLSGVLVGLVTLVIKPYTPAAASGETYAANRIGTKIQIGPQTGIGPSKLWEWQASSWLPQSIEKNLEVAARTRAGMISFNQRVAAGSMIDVDDVPQSAGELLKYLPRALQIGLFAPFPDTWMQKPSMARLLAVAETICWYLFIPGFFLAIYYRRSPELMVTVLFAGFFITVFSFVTPNVGTLYRYRYAYEFLLMLVAAGGWLEWYFSCRSKRGELPARSIDDKDDGGEAGIQAGSIKQVQGNSKRRLVSAALVVSLLTLIGYLGFFARDIFMVRVFGAGNEMDIFFLGAMIPMFFVSVLSIPVGAAITPVYSALRSDDRAASTSLMGGAVVFQMLFMAVLSVLMYFGAPFLFSALGWHYSSEKTAEICAVMNVYLFIMLIGGVIIIANAILNAEGGLVLPAVAQLAVPVVVILMLVMFGVPYGIYAAVYGMLLGQLVNLVLVATALHSRNLLFPLFQPSLAIVLRVFPFRQYGILAVAALSTALFVPLANAIAALLPSPGSVAIIGMGTKVIMLFTGVMGIGMTTVLLPYFSNLVAKSYHLKAQADLSFFLLLTTLISVPLALILRLFAAAITYKLVANSAMADKDINELIRTIQYGVAQLPFYTCSLIAIKYITAYQRAGIILWSSLAGLVLTVLLSQVFIDHMGVSGISLAMTIALMVSTTILVAYVSYLKHLPTNDSIFIFANWVIFAAMFATLYYHMIEALIILGIIYVLFSIGNWKALIAEWASTDEARLVEQPANGP